MRIIDSTTGKGCTLNVYDNGIYEFTFTAATRDAINTWVELSINLYRKIGFSTQFVPFIFDTTNVGAPPLSYAIRRAPDIMAGRPQHPQHLITATAIISEQATLHDIARPMINTLMRVQRLRDVVKFFEPTERKDAINWLLRERVITK